MAHSFLIFDFGTNEEAAQQGRHKVEGWKQGFRLGNKITIKFERPEPKNSDAATNEDAEKEDNLDSSADLPETTGKSKHNAAKKKASMKKVPQNDKPETDTNVRMLIRLDFSDHEKLSHQRWLDRIPSEEPFKSVEFEIVRSGDPSFGKTTGLFETLT